MNSDDVSFTWGLLGHERIGTERRTRTLGLGAAVRTFNELAVPGLGGVWFGKQLFLALLGIRVAEVLRNKGRRAQNIETANAVEALGCWLAMQKNGGVRDPRLRGTTKLQGKTDLAFSIVRKFGFYVTQPMRQATVQPLRALGFVESPSERFSTYCCTKVGEEFLDAVSDGHRPFNRTVQDHLVGWGSGSPAGNSRPLYDALSPLTPLAGAACEILRHQLVTGSGVDANRRRQALAWVDAIRNHDKIASSWKNKPQHIEDGHWRDLQAGGHFFLARDAAIRVLEAIEVQLAKAQAANRRVSLDGSLPNAVTDLCRKLRNRAEAFRNYEHDPSPEGSADSFCHECLQGNDSGLIEKLVARDGRVLQLRGRHIVPGVAFRSDKAAARENSRSAEDEGVETEISNQVRLPPGISYRVRNLCLLNLDLHGELSQWLDTPETSGEAE